MSSVRKAMIFCLFPSSILLAARAEQPCCSTKRSSRPDPAPTTAGTIRQVPSVVGGAPIQYQAVQCKSLAFSQR